MSSRHSELRHFLYAGLIATAFYFASFYGCESFRRAKGPWRVEFSADSNAQPQIVINQPALRITNVAIIFAGETFPTSRQAETVAFNTPTNEAPFGKVVFRDTTFLPGTITLSIFGHEIELLPRVLVIDQQERPWRSDERIVLK